MSFIHSPTNHACWVLWSYRLSRKLYLANRTALAELVWRIARWLTTVDIYPSAEIGKGMRLYHPFCIVIGQKVRIG